MRLTRREVLRTLAVAPLAAAGGCCASKYPRSLIEPGRGPTAAGEPILAPARRRNRATRPAGIVDVHAHFFNGSDVPVRGFIAECFGHKAPPLAQPLIKALALLAEKISQRAPTALEELNDLQDLEAKTREAGADYVDQWLTARREATARRVVAVVRGSEFERRYLEMNPATAGRNATGRRGIDEAEVLDVATVSRSSDEARGALLPQQVEVATARAKLEFLFYMLAPRTENLRAYIDAYAGETDPSGVDVVLGSLVDFDYWLDCPPRSSHDDQLALHNYIAQLHDHFMVPVVAYNPWTDIEQDGAGLARVLREWEAKNVAGVKIYPPTGFMAAGNASIKVKTRKRRPNLKRLDEVLEKFFVTCASREIPIMAHTAHSNGRDDAHDEFSGPIVWDRLLCGMAEKGLAPILNFGHLGGDDSTTTWTQQFARLIKSQPKAKLFADLGYWDTLMCNEVAACDRTRQRLEEALAVRISSTETVGQRVMFGSDWLMLSQVSGWREYPARVRKTLTAAFPASVVTQIMSGNARTCFTIPP